MRLCLVSREFAPFHGWGAGTYASLMAQAMAAHGHDVHVLTEDPALVAQGPRARPGVTFHAVDLDRFPASLPAYQSAIQRYSMAAYLALQDLHQRHRFDYIEFPEFLGEAYFTLRAKRTLGAFDDAVVALRLHMTIRQIRALNADDWIDIERATVEHMEAWSLLHADALVPPCRAMLDVVHERAGESAAQLPPARVIPLPFPMQQTLELGARGAAPRREPRESGASQTPLIVFAGRWERRKGVHLLVDAAQQLLRDGQDLTVRFVGEDTLTGPLNSSMRDWLESRIEPALRAHFEFRPRARRADLADLYAQSTCVCLPSLWENFPFACLEAMALGTPIVGSDAGGMAEIIEDGVSGVLAKAGDASDLAAQLRRVITDASLRRRIAKNAPARIEALCNPTRVAREVSALADHVRLTRAVAFGPSPSAPSGGGGAAPRRSRGDATGEANGDLRETAPATALADSPSVPNGGGGERSEPGEVFRSDFSLLTSHFPLVSIIIPVFNLHQHLEAALASVRDQTFTDWEVLVVDDGSTLPATIAALDKLSRTADPRLRVIRSPRGGLSRARNTGIHEARGRWVVPLDADDMLEETFLEKALAAAQRNPRAKFITAGLRSFDVSADRPIAGWMPMGGDLDWSPVINASGSCVALLDRASILEVGGYDEELPAYEDWDLYCAFLERNWTGETIPQFLVLHRLRADSMMHKLDARRHQLLRARLIAKHPRLTRDPSRTLRFLLGDCINLHGKPDIDPRAVHDAAQHMLHTNIRYRLADRLNLALKRSGLHSLLKRIYLKLKTPH